MEKLANSLLNKLTFWYDKGLELFPNFLVALLILIIFWILSKIVANVFKNTTKRFSHNVAVGNLMATISQLSIISAGLFLALDVLHLDKALSSLLAGIGLVGLTLGFAFQETASNFISGIYLSIRNLYNIGDFIETSDGHFGVVKEVHIRETIIENLFGQIIVVPNKTLFQNYVMNYSSTGYRLIIISVGVTYEESLDKAQRIAKEAVEGKLPDLHPKMPIEVVYKEFGDSSINMDVRIWIKYPTEHYWTIIDSAIKNIKSAFDENDITIPFPIRTLYTSPTFEAAIKNKNTSN